MWTSRNSNVNTRISKKSGKRKKRRCRARPASRKNWSAPSRNSKRRDARVIYREWRNCSTEEFRNLRRNSLRLPPPQPLPAGGRGALFPLPLREGARGRGQHRHKSLFAPASPKMKSPKWFHAGPASRFPSWSRVRRKSCCAWSRRWDSAWSVRVRRSPPCRTLFDVRARACPIPTARSVPSCFWVRPASAKPNCANRWPHFYSIPRMRWCALICLNTWRSIQWRG